MNILARAIKNGEYIRKQTLLEHTQHVSALCKKYAYIEGFPTLGELIGLMHDMGKGTQDFSQYVIWRAEHGEKEIPKEIHHHKHAPTGAVYVYERWMQTDDIFRRRTAQIIALCIYGHHSGLMDCVDKDYHWNFQTRMEQDKTKFCYQEAVQYFEEHICSREKLDRLFDLACEEIKYHKDSIRLSSYGNKDHARRDFQLGMLTRLMLSILVDADRWDSACFEYHQDSMAEKTENNWTTLLQIYETFARETFNGQSILDKKRQQISDVCRQRADGKIGIYRLSAPTGGGKTFASLRFALQHAKINRQDRIFYIIPYNTILDQNAHDIRCALDQYSGILEHHSNVVIEDEEEREIHKQLTERWDSEIVLTSMVQFLNALFRKENTNARRMHRLANAVLIFDEIQALPPKCKGLFERAIIFLATICHTTIVLCTATQMEFCLPEQLQPIEIMGSEEEVYTLHRDLNRVTYVPEINTGIDNQEAAERLEKRIEEKAAVLMIVNTKAVAWNIYEQTCHRLEESGYEKVHIIEGLTDEEICDRARQSENFEILCVHLSTLLCPEHRMEYIRWIKNWTKAGGKTFCVSTALIEAGINISFPVVVRSLAGLPSIIQAAGRCNRNKEQELGTVYIWDLTEENLKRLPEIEQGKRYSRETINCWSQPDQLGSPDAVKIYFNKEHDERVENYPIGKDENLVSLLSDNRKRDVYNIHKKYMRQSFQEAGERFHVIDENTKPILVPYKEGKQLIQQLCGEHSMEEEIALLRKAQSYCVNVYDTMYQRLSEQGALVMLGESGVVALKEGYYSDEAGIVTEAEELDAMII